MDDDQPKGQLPDGLPIAANVSIALALRRHFPEGLGFCRRIVLFDSFITVK